MIAEHYDEAMGELIGRIEHYLKRQTSFMVRDAGQSRRMPPRRMPAEDISWYAKDGRIAWGRETLNRVLQEEGLYIFLFGQVAERSIPIKDLRSGFPWGLISQMGGRSVRNYAKGFPGRDPEELLKSHFTEERILECMAENSFYGREAKKALKKIQVIRLLAEDFAGSVPDNYAMLYPEARAMHREFILHIGPTNSGKTHDAVRRLAEAESGVYLAPLRLLAYEQYETLTSLGVKCSMVTGEERILSEGSLHQSSTIEMLDIEREYDVAVIDEAQMCADPARGGYWTSAILGIQAEEVHVCASPDAEEVLLRMVEACGDSARIERHERKTPLIAEKTAFRYPQDVREGDALIVFSRRDVHACAADLADRHIPCSVIYGSLPYDVRHAEAARFASGQTKVVVATDAIGMGMNLPIRRVVFLKSEKFDGKKRRKLEPGEIKQIGGRAGRYGIHPKGYVTAHSYASYVTRCLQAPVSVLEKGVINIPPVFFEKEGRVSEILDAWDSLPATQDYDKSDIKEKIQLAEELEGYSDDKATILSFVSIPFDEKQETVHELWLSLFLCVIEGQEPDLAHFFEENNPEKLGSGKQDAQELETMYKAYDLLFAYCTRYKKEESMDMIMERKRAVSEKLSDIFAENAFEKRVCRECGRKIPWLSEYTLCDSCFRKRMHEGTYRHWH